jgi:hypothetical protein
MMSSEVSKTSELRGQGDLGYIFDLVTSRYEKHGVPEISLLDRKSLDFLGLEVPIFCNRERARAG